MCPGSGMNPSEAPQIPLVSQRMGRREIPWTLSERIEGVFQCLGLQEQTDPLMIHLVQAAAPMVMSDSRIPSSPATLKRPGASGPPRSRLLGGFVAASGRAGLRMEWVG